MIKDIEVLKKVGHRILFVDIDKVIKCMVGMNA